MVLSDGACDAVENSEGLGNDEWGTMKRSLTRRCKAPGCSVRFEPAQPWQTWHDEHCGAVIALAKLEKIKASKAKVKRDADRKSDLARKQKLKTRSDYMREAQVAWNFYVRMRDFGLPCASCGDLMLNQKRGGVTDCSHYRSVGASPGTRFHLHNAAAACVKCNRYLGGNVAALRVGLIDRIGVAKIEALEANNEVRKFDIVYLIRIKKIFTKKAKRLIKRMED